MKLFGILFLSLIPILLGLFRRSAIIKNGGIYENTVFEPDLKVNLERYWIKL